MIIYAIKNKKNNRLLIGQTSRAMKIRWSEHRNLLRKNSHENPYLQYSWNKHGEEQFECVLLEEIESQDEANKLEKKYIKQYSPNVYNIRSGGGEGCKFSPESRKKMSISQKKRAKRTNNKSQKAGALAQKEKWKNDKEYAKRMIKERKDRWKNPEYRSKCLSNLLKYATDSEHKSKISKELWRDPEYRSKFEQNFGKVISPIGEIHEVVGLRKFCRKHNLDPSSLSKVCKGKSKQHKGWIKYEK